MEMSVIREFEKGKKMSHGGRRTRPLALGFNFLKDKECVHKAIEGSAPMKSRVVMKK